MLEKTVCTACPMLCDDVAVHPDGRSVGGPPAIERACDHGRRSIAAALARRAATGRPEATIDGRPASAAEAVAEAVGLLGGARRVLVTGLAKATLSAQRLAAGVAERAGGAFDTGARDGRLLTGPTIARAGEVTAQWEELRDRADVVVLWFTDPSESHPRFVERFLGPVADGRPRSIVSVGPSRPLLPESSPDWVPRGSPFDHVPAERTEAVELARALEAEDDVDPRAARLLGAIRSAACVAIVTGTGDSIGVERWAVARLVRHLAHRKPAFEIPLGAGVFAGGGNAAGAAAVATWRHGAAGAIALASDRGGRFEPAEADGERLLARGEVDLVCVVGGLSESMRRALQDATRRPATAVHDVVWIGGDPEQVVRGSRRTVFVRSATTLLETSGEMLREDGRLVPLRPIITADAPSTADVLAQFVERLAGGDRHPQEARP